MTHDYSHFPGGENPLLHRDVMTEEGNDGLTAYDTLGYPAPQFDRQSVAIETLDQHDLADHPGVDTPSGLDHANPRGMISTDGKLNVPEHTVGNVRLQDEITKILARNLSKVTVRLERPGYALSRSLNLGAGASSVSPMPVIIVPADDNRYRLTMFVSGNAGDTVIIGSFEEVGGGQGITLIPGMVPVSVDAQSEFWIVKTANGGTNATILSYVVELYEKN